MSLQKIIKDSRKAKNRSQKELSEGILSIQQLSHFEKNYSSISAEKYYMLLKKLNITINELDYYIEWNDHQDQFRSSLKATAEQRDESKFQKIIDDESILLKKYDNDINKHNLVILYQYRQQLFGHLPHPDFPIQIIYEYLKHSLSWHSYELNLLEDSLVFIPSTVLRTLFENGKSRLSPNIAEANAKKKIANLYFIALEHSLKHNDIDFSEFLLFNFKELLSKNRLLNESTILKFYEGIILIKKDKYTQGFPIASNALEIMQFANDTASYNKYNDYLETMINK